MSFWRSLTGRLFKLVFGWYLALAITVTSVQLMLEYSSINGDIASNLDSLGHSFAPSVADAVWSFDRPQLDAMAKGIMQAAFVTGIRIESSRGEALAQAGVIPTGDDVLAKGLFAPYKRERFTLAIKTPRGEQKSVGQLVLYSDRSVALERIKYSFFVIVINSLIKTTGLWLIFYLVITRSLARPMEDLTQAVSRIEFAADPAGPVTMDYPHQDEMGRLLSAMNKMQERVATAQRLVAERTNELATALGAAESANRLKSAFLANVSHELRTPLNLILGYAQILKMDTSRPEDERSYAKEISRSGGQLLALINDVLEVSHIEAGAAILQSGAFQLRDLLAAVRTSAELKAQEKGLAIATRFSPNLPQFVVGDADKLRRLLSNLLSNSVKRSERGQIEFSASAETAETADRRALLQFTVSDTGASIAAEELANIFQPFAQTRYGAASGEGTGLELALSREYAQLLGGTLEVVSSPGQGCTFRLAVPVELAELPVSVP